MWISERGLGLTAREAQAEAGTVTLGGDPAAVLLGGERRLLPVYAPGGYCWRPAPGDRVLVLKAGAEREEPCIVGTVQPETGLAPGEVRLSGGSAAVKLGRDGLELTGEIKVNGQTLEEYAEKIVKKVLSGD